MKKEDIISKEIEKRVESIEKNMKALEFERKLLKVQTDTLKQLKVSNHPLHPIITIVSAAAMISQIITEYQDKSRIN